MVKSPTGFTRAIKFRAKEIGATSERRDVMLDSYIVSATPYEKLRKKYDDGSWDRARFADAHILFPERLDQYD